MDADVERRGRRRREPRATSGSARATTSFWLGKGTLKTALQGPFEVLEERPGRELVGWRYAGPFDELPAVRRRVRARPATSTGSWPGPRSARTRAPASSTSRPGCGAEDYQLGKALGLPVIAPIDEDGHRTSPGFGSLTGRDVRDVAEPIVDAPRATRAASTASSRTPTATRTAGGAGRRSSSASSTSGSSRWGRSTTSRATTLTPEQVDASLRYQIMEVVDRIRWIPEFGYDRELDWLRNMHDWMISKKRYWGLALPIYDCTACGTVEVIGGRDELHERAVEGWERFEGHTPHRPWVDEVRIACPACGAPVERIKDVGNPWLDAGIVPFSTLHFREDPEYWAQWFPADFITESFPGQFRNWFYSMLAMSTVLRREPPFKTIFGYALVFGEDGRPMHKSWGNAIDFDEAAERMGVDVMRWMFAKARPEENILFGWHAADEARRELLVLWNVYAFFVTYARLAGWTPGERRRRPVAERAGARSLDPVARGGHGRRRRGAAARRRRGRRDARAVDVHRRPLDLVPAPVAPAVLALGRHRGPGGGVRDAPRGAGRRRPGCSRRSCRSCRRDVRQPACRPSDADAPDSVHLTRWPTEELAGRSRRRARGVDGASPSAPSTWRGRCAARTGSRRASRWRGLARRSRSASGALRRRRCSTSSRDEINVKAVEPIADGSELVERRVKPLLPKIGKRLGAAIPAVMAAARDGRGRVPRRRLGDARRRARSRPTRSRSRPRRDRARRWPTTTASCSSSTPS